MVDASCENLVSPRAKGQGLGLHSDDIVGRRLPAEFLDCRIWHAGAGNGDGRIFSIILDGGDDRGRKNAGVDL